MSIVPIGGRIKAASIGLDHLYAANGVSVDQHIAELRRVPLDEFRTAFFPRTGRAFDQAIRGVGFYRPSLKTDQGMGGNFLPFTIDPDLEETDLSCRAIGCEEGFAIEEAWNTDSNGSAHEVRDAFRGFDLERTHAVLQRLETRRAEKGRLPFFFIRPAIPERPIVFGKDILGRVDLAVKHAIKMRIGDAEVQELYRGGSLRPANLIYCQPDVFVLTDGTVAVEKINCPDVGFFLAAIDTEGSRILPQVRSIMEGMRAKVVERIIERMGKNITIVTRDEVLGQQEDVLELREIAVLLRALKKHGAKAGVIPVSGVGSVPNGTALLLLNLDYRSESTEYLLRRHSAGEVECFPNPYLQMECQRATELTETMLDLKDKLHQQFFDLARSQPSGESGTCDVLRLIDRALTRSGNESDIIHAVLETEVVPVFRKSLHSWRQFAARAARPENKGGQIRFRSIPATPGNLMLTSSTGPRLHAFRFMWVA